MRTTAGAPPNKRVNTDALQRRFAPLSRAGYVRRSAACVRDTEPMPSPTPITLAEAKDALLRSGYLLESRVESLLRNAGYYAEANASYQDPSTGKSRELDLSALAARRSGPGESDFLFPVLLVECVNNPQPLGLITKDPMVPFLHHHEVKLSGLPVKFPESDHEDAWESFTDFLGFEKFHHYCKGRIATQFCSFQQKKDGHWMAWHDEEHFESFKKLCDAVDYAQVRHYGNWVLNGHESVNVQIYYPVLILHGQLWDVRSSKRGLTLKRARHLQYRRSVATGRGEEDYQIDVIEERFLPSYLRIIDDETTKAARLLRRRHIVVRTAIEKIAAKAQVATTPEAKREAMEF